MITSEIIAFSPFIQAIRVLSSASISFLIALLLTPIVMRGLEKFSIRKQIRTSEEAPIFSNLHKKKEGTPTMGGVIIWGTAILIAGFFRMMDIFFDGIWTQFNFINRAETYLPIAAMLIAALVGLTDDIFGILKIGGTKSGGLKVRNKLILYTAIALLGAWWFYYRLGWDVLFIPFLGYINIGIWYLPLFIFVIVASAFSANETDGLDGLLGGVSLFTFCALCAVAFALGRYDLAAFSGVIIGALLAFLWFNIYPAKFFMGDTGSMALGITIGVIAMLTNTALLLPFFAFIFVVESLSVIIQMSSKKIFKRKIFLSTPIHHHFEAKGWHETTVTMRFWIVAAILNVVGVVIFFLSRIF
ncbi:MAG: phospho-N-acetylmuramoyl-pentapeptide-transferase [Candidatus Paceibacterota bacterium]